MTDERRTAVSNVARLSPDDIATRAFSTSFRGLSEPEVRGFLKRIGEEMQAAAAREQQLRDQVSELEDRLRNPPPLDEQELLEALGDETAKLLRSAREAAADIREKAEETATRIRSEAQADADRVREEAAELLDRRVAEADAEVAAMHRRAEEQIAADREATDAETAAARADADGYAERVRADADVAAEERIASATATGRSMVDEARRVRERVLADLGHRRALLQAQIVELRAGREQLLDAYRVVKRSFLDATTALAAAEDAAAAVRPEPFDAEALEAAMRADDTAGDLADDVVPDVDPEPETDSESATEPEPETDPESATEPEPETESADETEPESGTESADETTPAPDAADAAVEGESGSVSDLFARIREQAEVTEPAPPSAGEAPVDAERVGEQHAGEPAVVEDDEVAEPVVVDAFEQLLAEHLPGAARRAKRALQDEQNEVLDVLRRQKGRPTAEAVLPVPDVQGRHWADALGEAVTAGYGAGAGSERAVPEGLAADLVTMLLEGLRDRLRDAVDNGDPEGVADRVNARYREWRIQHLDALLGDLFAGAYAAGCFDVLPDDTDVRWVPSADGCCADCADNALEAVRKGAPFPTGHTAPLAHPGCRCSVVAVD